MELKRGGDGRRGTATLGGMTTSTSPDLGRPISGDVVRLILDDTQRFEAHVRLRDNNSDRDALGQASAARAERDGMLSAADDGA